MATIFEPPHDFAHLRNGTPPTLLVGCGLSGKLAPSLDELKKKCLEAEQQLEICPPNAASIVAQLDMNTHDSLYVWADKVLEHLESKGASNPKLKLAKALGLTSEKSWHCGTRLSIQHTTPRHRVIARFAREERWGSIWTFNWDCLIEAALESIGLDRDLPDPLQPWPTSYHTFVTREDYKLNNTNSITLHKPHGCAEALRRAENFEMLGDNSHTEALSKRFLIGKTELAKITDTTALDHVSITAKMNVYFSGKPFVCAGWSAQEPYFLDFLSSIAEQLVTYPKREDRLSIIDPSHNPEFDKLKTIFDVADMPCLFEIKKESKEIYTTDWLFLWMQTVYGTEILLNRAKDATVITEIANLLAQVKKPGNFEFITKWFDKFLPAWVRLCWRAGLVDATDEDGKTIEPHRIRMEKRDEHIPWRRSGPRPELEAAGRLLVASKSKLSDWNMEMYPGAFWNESELALLIPVPAWQDADDHNSIASLKPLLEELKRNVAFISKVSILPITLNGDAPPMHIVNRYKSLVGRFLRISQYFAGENIDHIFLNNLSGGKA